MYAIVYEIAEDRAAAVGMPIEMQDLTALVEYCAKRLCREGTLEVWAYNVSGTAMLFDGRKSKKQKT